MTVALRPADVAMIAWRAFRHRGAARETIVAFRDARLRRLIAHAYEAVPYYRELLERHGIGPDQIRTAADLSRIPITTRRDRQTAPVAALRARGTDPARLIVHRTSGSSGQPVRVERTWLEERLTTAFRFRAHHDVGLRPRDRRARFVLPRPHDAQNWEGPLRAIRALRVYRKVSLDRRLPPQELLERLQAMRATALNGPPGILVRLARAMDRERWNVAPRLLISGGDVLTPSLRRQITAGFGAPVFDVYGSYETGNLAWECPRVGGFHVADDGVVLEVLVEGRPAEPGEIGEVVATKLHAFAAPFIRYRLGDLAIRGETPCPCGAPFSTLTEVRGRSQDSMPLANGRWVEPRELAAIMADQPTRWVGQHQLVQERADHVVLRIVPLKPPSPEILATFEAALLERLGPGIGLEVLLVPEIPLDANGKFQVSRSLVDPTDKQTEGGT